MKNTNSLRTVLLTGATLAILLAGANHASAIDLGIQVGNAPPPPPPEHRWASPYRGAVWIGGHQEWVNGRWVYVGGYYTYPPHRGAEWVPAHYHHGYYRPGHWSD